MKKYFENKDSENCYEKDYFDDIMRLNNTTKIEVFEAEIEFKTGYFWCDELLEIGEVGCGCGKMCEDYKPRNGKNGRCVHSKSPYGLGEKITLKL